MNNWVNIFLERVNNKNYHAIFIGRMQPMTIGHMSVVDDLLSKGFKSVNIALSTKQDNIRNQLSVNDRKKQIKSIYGNKLKVEGLETKWIFGLYLDDHIEHVKKVFKINDDNPIVIIMGKEDDRYNIISKNGKFFDIGKQETQSEEQKTGIYGVDLKYGGKEGKISATDIRNAINDGDTDYAMKYIAGDNIIKKYIIELYK